MIRGKGDKERLAPISARAEQAVARLARARRRTRAVAVPRRQGASEPGAAVPDRPRAGRAGRDRARAGQPARPAPRLRHASAGGRRRPARAAVAARPCRHRDDADLHPCRQRAAGRAGQRAASAGARDVDGERARRLPRRRRCRPISNSKSRSPSSTGGSPNCATPRARGRSTSTPKSAARGQVGEAAARHLCAADPVAEDAGRAPSRAAALQGLCRRADRGFPAAGGRPRLWRRPGDHRRAGADRRPPGDADRA